MSSVSRASARGGSLSRQRRLLIGLLIAYFVLGTASQKLVPGVDEVFPFFGWSLFSRVPAIESRYTVRIEVHEGRRLDSPVAYSRASAAMVRGNPAIARKVIQRLGRAAEAGDSDEVERVRRTLERNYLRGRVEYTLSLDRYEPLVMWTSGEVEESRFLARFSSERPRKKAR